MQRVEEVDLEIELVSNMVPIEGHSLDKRYMSDIAMLALVWVFAVACCQCMVDRQVQRPNSDVDIIWHKAPTVFDVGVLKRAVYVHQHLLSLSQWHQTHAALRPVVDP